MCTIDKFAADAVLGEVSVGCASIQIDLDRMCRNVLTRAI